MNLARILRALAIKRQLDRDIKLNIKPARIAKQKAAEKGQRTRVANLRAQTARLQAEGLL